MEVEDELKWKLNGSGGTMEVEARWKFFCSSYKTIATT